MTGTMTDDQRAQLRAAAAADYLTPTRGATRTTMTFAEWNDRLGNTNPAVGEVDPAAQITLGEWAAAATGWMGWILSDVLMHLFRLGMTSTEWFDEAARVFVGQCARTEALERRSVRDWWNYLRLADDKYRASFALGAGEELIPLYAFLNRILLADLTVHAWYARLRSRRD